MTVRSAAVLAGLAAFLAAGVRDVPARAASLPGADRVLSYAVVDQDVRDVLVGIGEQLGLRTVVSSRVHGQLRGRLPAGGAAQTLDSLARLYGFEWYCDGQALFVSAFDEATSKVSSLGAVQASVFVQTLDSLGASDPRWPVRSSGNGDIVMIDGPPHYVALVDQTLSALERRSQAAAPGVRIFRGSAASTP